MPIIIPRHGELPDNLPSLSQEQRDKMWEIIIRTWINNNPDKFRSYIEDCTEADNPAENKL